MSQVGVSWTTLVDVAELANALAQPELRVVDARATASTAVRVMDARYSLADKQAGAAG